MAYGYDDDALYSQVLLRSYRKDMNVGSLGDLGGPSNYGFDTSWIGPVVQGVTTVAAAGVQAGAAGAAGKHASATAQAQAEAEAARLAALVQTENAATERAKTYAMYGAGTLVLLAALGGGLYYLSRQG